MSNDRRTSLDDARRHNLAKHNLGKRVRVLRTGKGWSQDKLADESGTDRTTISRLERAHDGTTLDTLLGVADALGLPLANLFCDDAGQPVL